MQLNELLAKIDSLKEEIDHLRPLKPADEQRIMQKFRLDWTYHSNAIEGNSLTLGETRAFLLEGLTADGKPMKDHLDLRGHNNLIDYLIEYVRRNEQLTEKDIRGMHQILLHEPYETNAVTDDRRVVKKTVRLGEYKTTPNAVHTATGEIIHYTSPEDTPPKMHELLEWHRKETKSPELHPVVHAALFQHRFLAIHPFDDGNGRLGRILMNLILMRHGFPPVVIKLPARERYVAALRKADAGESGDIVSFVGECLVDSEELYLRGARGEPIEDSDDIEKQVALLKQELRDVPKPLELSRDLQLDFLTHKLIPLLERIDKKVKQFDELFKECGVDLQFIMQSANHMGVQLPRDLAGAKLLKLFNEGPTKSLEELGLGIRTVYNGWFRELRFYFRWDEFLRDGTNDFSVGAGFEVVFEKNKYRLKCDSVQLKASYLYQEWLSEDETKNLVSGLAKRIFDQIQQSIDRNRKRV